jgi:xanthine dehydrogenase accessory factor
MSGEIDNADWPLFGWIDDVRAPLAAATEAGRSVVLGTLYKVEGSAPRGPGAQMLFDGNRASGYFSGDCIEGDVATHAAQVLESGDPRHLHYGMGSPWIDIRLRCGGALHILLERIMPSCQAAEALSRFARERRACLWRTDGITRNIMPGTGPLLAMENEPFSLTRRYDPPRRIIVSGGDPGALAVAQLGALAQFETILLRPGGPDAPPPFPVAEYLRDEPAQALERLGVDRWTAYVGATHEDHHDLGGCMAALRGGAGYVGMIGARSRAAGRLAALKDAGATEQELDTIHLSPGVPGLGKAPWEVATGIVAEIMHALNPERERA